MSSVDHSSQRSCFNYGSAFHTLSIFPHSLSHSHCFPFSFSFSLLLILLSTSVFIYMYICVWVMEIHYIQDTKLLFIQISSGCKVRYSLLQHTHSHTSTNITMNGKRNARKGSGGWKVEGGGSLQEIERDSQKLFFWKAQMLWGFCKYVFRYTRYPPIF